MDLTTQTPVQIDTELAKIYAAYYEKTRAITIQQVWLADIEKKVAQVAAGTYRYHYMPEYDAPRDAENIARLTAKIEALREEAREIMRGAAPFNHEFDRRGGWSRFFLVKNNGGHIHSSMECQTCNKRGKATEFGWLPELSGTTEVDAVKAHGAILCTVCYPSAPVEWTDGRKADDDLYCAGGGKYLDDRKAKRTGFYSGNWGICTVCGTAQTVSKAWTIRKHKKA